MNLAANIPTATDVRVGPTDSDRRRQIAVVVAEIVCLVGTLVGVGVLGGPEVQQASGGALAADATLLAPGSPAFGIWSVIYLGLAAYTVWQLLPAQAAHPRHRAIGWLAVQTMIANALWLLVVRARWLWVSVAVIVWLVLALGVLVRRLTQIPATGVLDRVVVDGTFGLYLGWVAVATCANITATLVESGVRPEKPLSEVIAALVLVVAAGLGVLFARRLGGRWAVAGAMAWGLVWIAWARWADQPMSALVSLVAVAAAITVLLAAARYRSATREGD